MPWSKCWSGVLPVVMVRPGIWVAEAKSAIQTVEPPQHGFVDDVPQRCPDLAAERRKGKTTEHGSGHGGGHAKRWRKSWVDSTHGCQATRSSGGDRAGRTGHSAACAACLYPIRMAKGAGRGHGVFHVWDVVWEDSCRTSRSTFTAWFRTVPVPCPSGQSTQSKEHGKGHHVFKG